MGLARPAGRRAVPRRPAGRRRSSGGPARRRPHRGRAGLPRRRPRTLRASDADRLARRAATRRPAEPPAAGVAVGRGRGARRRRRRGEPRGREPGGRGPGAHDGRARGPRQPVDRTAEHQPRRSRAARGRGVRRAPHDARARSALLATFTAAPGVRRLPPRAGRDARSPAPRCPGTSTSVIVVDAVTARARRHRRRVRCPHVRAGRERTTVRRRPIVRVSADGSRVAIQVGASLTVDDIGDRARLLGTARRGLGTARRARPPRPDGGRGDVRPWRDDGDGDRPGTSTTGGSLGPSGGSRALAPVRVRRRGVGWSWASPDGRDPRDRRTVDVRCCALLTGRGTPPRTAPSRLAPISWCSSDRGDDGRGPVDGSGGLGRGARRCPRPSCARGWPSRTLARRIYCGDDFGVVKERSLDIGRADAGLASTSSAAMSVT